MPKEFIIRGKTASLGTEVINMTGYRPGYGYQLKDFQLYPSANIGAQTWEMSATLHADKASHPAPPDAPNFNEDGLIGTVFNGSSSAMTTDAGNQVINDLFVITQDLHLTVHDAAAHANVNWQLRFKEVKLTSSAEAVANYKQYTIYNTSQ